jgi:adhesin transport system outer membrane protein
VESTWLGGRSALAFANDPFITSCVGNTNLKVGSMLFKEKQKAALVSLGWTVTRPCILALIATILAACSSIDPNISDSSAAPPSAVLYSEVMVRSMGGASAEPDGDGGDLSNSYALGPIEATEDLEMSVQLYSNAPTESQQVLSLGDVLGSVWQEHPNVQRALSEVEATGYEISGARTGFYPYLSLSATQASNNASATTLNVVQPLWAGGRVLAEVGEAEAGQYYALADLNKVRLDLALDASEAYMNVVLAEEQGLLWARYIKNLEALLNTITRRADLGVSPPSDIQTAQTRLSQARAGLQASHSTLLRSRLHLESLLHRPVRNVSWPEESYRLSHQEMFRILDSRAVAFHPYAQLASAEISIQKAQVKIAKSAIYPQLSLQYSSQLDQSDGDFTPDSSTQLVLQFSSDSGLRGYSSYRAILQRLSGAEQDLIYSKRDITDIVSSAYSERNASQEQFYAQVDATRAAVKLVDSFLRQFKVGRKAWLEVLNAHREAHEALLEISNIKRSYWAANTRLALHGMMWARLSAVAPPIEIPSTNP